MISLHAFMLLISMARRLLILLVPSIVSFPSSAFPLLLPPSLQLALSYLLHPPLLTTPSTLMPSSPSLKPQPPVASSPHISSFKYILHGSYQKNFNIFGGTNWILYRCIHRVKQTIVHNYYDFKQICASDYLWG